MENEIQEYLDELEKYVTYLEDSLTAAVTGELPEKYDLNQLLLAKRGRHYLKLLEEGKST